MATTAWRARARWWITVPALACLVSVGSFSPPFGAASATAASSVPALASTGCALTQPVGPGTSDQLLIAGGDNGAFVREIPPSYTGRVPLPVVIDLHGWGEQASFQAQLSQLGAYGATHGFITITPQVAEPALVWRLGASGKDVKFVGGLLRTIDTTLCVDRNRIYITGYSLGAIFVSTLACVDAGEVAAVAAVAGIQNPAGCHPSRPVPVLAFHGTADPFVPYLGGVGSAALKLAAPDGSHRTLGQVLGKKAAKLKGPTIPENAAAWAKRDGCAPTPNHRSVASRVTLIAYACPHGNDVDLYRISGGGHAWPGSAISKAIAPAVGYTTMAISADQIMWAFFDAHPLRH